MRKAGAPVRRSDLAALVGHPDAARVWKSMDVVAQHEALAVLGLRVRIMPTRRGPGFRPEDVIIDWTMEAAA